MEQVVRLRPPDPQIAVMYYRIGEVHLLQSRTDEVIASLEGARSANLICARPAYRRNDRHWRFADAPLGVVLSIFRIGMPSTYGVSFLVVLIAFLLFLGALP